MLNFNALPTFIYNMGTGKDVPLNERLPSGSGDFYIKYRKDKIIELGDSYKYSNFSSITWNSFLKVIKGDKLNKSELEAVLELTGIPPNCRKNLISAVKEGKIKEI